MILERARDFVRGKKITVMRVGLIGRGIGDTAFLAESGAEVLVVDDAPQSVMQPAVDALRMYTNVTFKFGSYDNADFELCDFVLVGAGAPLDLPCLTHARERNIPLMQSAALFAKLSGIPIVGVTGTRGKSTTTHMIYHVLSQVTEGAPVLLGGNVRGVSNLQLLKDTHEDSVAVMELDSWQLQGFCWMEMSPYVSVFTNFMEDHLNYYMQGEKSRDEAMDLYFKDKANIFRYQEEGGVLVTTQAVFNRAEQFMRSIGEDLLQDVRLVDSSILPEDCLLSMPGEHNRLNAALATEALRATGLTDEEIFHGLATFPGIPGRLEYLGEKEGIRIYNDNNATTPQATIEGIKAVAEKGEDKKNVILIAGGAYKDVDPSALVPYLNEYCKQVLLIPGTGTEKLIAQLKKDTIPINWNSVEGVSGSEVIESAVKAGLAFGEPGDVLLFSPAFASFGLFTNEYDRNDQFVQRISQYLDESFQH
jgi:UDP-N-acetylmuramoylalanine--D-glutamate ligase